MMILYYPYPQDLIFYSWATTSLLSEKVNSSIWDLVFFNMPWCGQGGRDTETVQALGLNKKDIRLMRNGFFARKGYVFKDKMLGAFYRNFLWYIEDSSFSVASNDFEPDVSRFISLLKGME